MVGYRLGHRRPLLAGLSVIIPVTLVILADTRRQMKSMLRDANFRLVRTPTGIRVSSGLTSTTNKTIDFDRIQGVRVEEPLLWRRFGWARVLVDVAGAKGDGEQAGVADAGRHRARLPSAGRRRDRAGSMDEPIRPGR